MSIAVDSPRTLDEALAVLRDATPRTRLLAGGTDLMVELASGRTAPDRVVDLGRLTELRGIAREAAGTRLFARTNCTELLSDAAVRSGLPLLAAAAREFAAPQIRHRATLAGNLATASPAGDLLPVLLALGATVRLRSQQGARDVPAESFFTGYRRHAGRPDELIESVFVPARPAGERTLFRKVGTRGAQSIAKVAVALSVRVGTGGAVVAVRGAAAAVADRPVLLPSLAALAGTRPDRASIAAAATAAALHDCAPIDDVRSTARYRRHALQRVLASALHALLPEV